MLQSGPLDWNLFGFFRWRVAFAAVAALGVVGGGAVAIARATGDVALAGGFAGTAALLGAAGLALLLQRALAPLNATLRTLARLADGDVAARVDTARMGAFAPVGALANRIADGRHQLVDPRHQPRGRESLDGHRGSLFVDPRDGILDR